MTRHRRFLIHFVISLFLLVALFNGEIFAFERSGPFPHFDQNPLCVRHVSITPRRADLLNKGKMEIGINSDYSNIFQRWAQSGGLVDLDMELWKLNFIFRIGVGDDFELFTELPFYHLSGGFLDKFVQKFHRAFHLPDGGRGTVPNGRYSYVARKNGTNLFNYSPVSFLEGDFKFGFRHQFLHENKRQPAVSFGFAVEVPTAPPDRGIGSGGVDAIFDLAIEKGGKHWAVYINNAYAIFSTNGWEEEMMRQTAWQFALTGEVIIIKYLSFILQLTGGTPSMKNMGVTIWDGWPVDLTVGFAGNIPSRIGRFQWRVALAEDVTYQGPAVDFTFISSLSWIPEFGKKDKRNR